MSIKELYQIKAIDKKLANEIQIKHHYLHKKANCTYAFGLFEKNEIIGVILYGTPCGSKTATIFGKDEQKSMLELLRLWIKDGTPKNTESYFISNTIKLLDHQLIFSYADPAVGHLGVIYQACNFTYLERSKRKGGILTVKNYTKHNRNLWGQYSIKEMREKYGVENVVYAKYMTKHRYIFFNKCSKQRKRELMSKCKYKEVPYPKNDERG